MENSQPYIFARHETFCPRYGWLKKGYDRIAGYNGFPGDEKIFDAPDAIERLGVGKNMVRSMRFWCMAFKIIEPVEGGPLRVAGPMRPTDFGRRLLSEDGWDPYLEDPASLWLLHWKLYTIPVIVTAWSVAIHFNMPGEFGIGDLGRMLLEWKAQVPELQRLSATSFQKDASCFLRMYGSVNRKNRQEPDEIECPFTRMGLLREGETPQRFYFNPDDKADLADDILMAACFEYAAQTDSQAKSISLNRLAYGRNSPGTVFKVSESDIGNRLEKGIAHQKGGVFTESYGNRQLQFDLPPSVLAENALRHYYLPGTEKEL